MSVGRVFSNRPVQDAIPVLKLSSLSLAVLALCTLPACTTPNPTPVASAPTASPAAAPASAVAAAPAASTAFNFDRSGEDLSVRPQDDLFRAANGGWMKDTPIPADKAAYGNFSIMSDRADERVHTLVEELSKGHYPDGSNEQKIAAYFRAFTNEAAMDKAGKAPLQPLLAQVQQLRKPADVTRYMGQMQGVLSLPLALDVQPDQKAPTMNLPLTWQGGLGLPNREYYLSKDPRMAQARAAYLAYLQTLFRLDGDRKHAARSARDVLMFETRLAKAQWTEVANRDAQKTWNPMTRAQLASKAPGMDWQAFFGAAEMPSLARLNVSQPDYAQAVAKAVQEVPVATWKLYFRARVMDANANLLAKPWRDAHFAFHGKALSGSEQPKPRWQQGIDALDGALGEAVGQQYVARYFPADHKARMQALVANLLKAYGESIDGLTWMSPVTKVKAREKLSKYATKIGYPDKWRNYSGLKVKDGDPVGNAERAGHFDFKRVAAKLGQPVDRSEWLMTPQTVNAYYNPAMNEIVFPAAILEPPFFDMAADDAANYGAIGAIIGHEISHGFDDQGAQYDGDGKLDNWWTPQDAKAFDALGKRLVAQFAGYEPLPGHKVNGQLTLGENIADLSGLQIAYKAWKLSLNGATPPVINGLTGEQRFFYSFAHAWRSKYREELQLRLLTADPHSPPEFRANGTVMNHDGFEAAFGLKPGDKMYKAPQNRIRIW